MAVIINAKDNYDLDILKPAAQSIQNGRIVAFPTETVYGLGADGFNEKAVSKIFEIKGRPQDNPLILHISSIEMIYDIAMDYDKEIIRILIENFWPGPLTIILRKKSIVPDKVTAGLKSVGIRMPANKIALDLIALAQRPIAAPSANLSGRPSPTKAEHVIEDLIDKDVDYIIDGGSCNVGLESTIVDLTNKPTILRPGAITYEMLKEVLGEIYIDESLLNYKQKILIPKAPGMKYKHYAPNIPVIVVKGKVKKRVSKVKQLAEYYKNENKRVGILSFYETSFNFKDYKTLIIGSVFSIEECMKNLFSSFRLFEKMDIDIIICEWNNNNGFEALALENRLFKAASYNIYEV
ncbi:L-threonylcarbamoyladenylate synthase [Caldicellulosiruptoraceae bacterium PP1]